MTAATPWEQTIHRAQELREAGWTYEDAENHRATVGLTGTWPLLAERLLDDGYSWPHIVVELGLDQRDTAGAADIKDLTARLERQAATITAQAATIEQLCDEAAELRRQLTVAQRETPAQRRGSTRWSGRIVLTARRFMR